MQPTIINEVKTMFSSKNTIKQIEDKLPITALTRIQHWQKNIINPNLKISANSNQQMFSWAIAYFLLTAQKTIDETPIAEMEILKTQLVNNKTELCNYITALAPV